MSNLSKSADAFTEVEIDGEIVVMSLATGDFFSLEGTAAAAWRLIDGSRDRASLIIALASEYDQDTAAITADVEEFIDRLQELGLIVAA